jgi:hypothetical protein
MLFVCNICFGTTCLCKQLQGACDKCTCMVILLQLCSRTPWAKRCRCALLRFWYFSLPLPWLQVQADQQHRTPSQSRAGKDALALLRSSQKGRKVGNAYKAVAQTAQQPFILCVYVHGSCKVCFMIAVKCCVANAFHMKSTKFVL